MHRKLKIHNPESHYIFLSLLLLFLLIKLFLPSILIAIPNNHNQIVNELGIPQINNFSPEVYGGQG